MLKARTLTLALLVTLLWIVAAAAGTSPVGLERLGPCLSDADSDDPDRRRAALARCAKAAHALDGEARARLAKDLAEAIAAPATRRLGLRLTEALGPWSAVAARVLAKPCGAALSEAPRSQQLLAARCIGALGPGAIRARPALARALAHADPQLRAFARASLQRIVTRTAAGGPALTWFLWLCGAELALLGLCVLIPASAQRTHYGICLAAVAAITAIGLSARVPELGMLLDGYEPLIYVMRPLPYALGAVFFAAAVKLIEKPADRRALLALLGLLLMLQGLQNAWLFGAPDCYRESGGDFQDGVCLQSTPYTCGAASMVTIAIARGRLDAVEHEAAFMSHTVPAGGVSDLSAAMGLRRLLPDCKVTPRVASLADLRDAELPCLAAMRLNYWADHLVAVLAVDAESVVLGDPLVGRVRLSHAKFEERWLGRLVTVTKSAEPRAGH